MRQAADRRFRARVGQHRLRLETARPGVRDEYVTVQEAPEL